MTVCIFPDETICKEGLAERRMWTQPPATGGQCAEVLMPLRPQGQTDVLMEGTGGLPIASPRELSTSLLDSGSHSTIKDL